MLIAKPVKPEWRNKIPAIVHVDGTARVQTVREETNAKLYRLLKAFEAITGVPVLINTSFNIKGQPIVETPEEAMQCFLNTGIDVLVLHDMLIEKNALAQISRAGRQGVFGRKNDRARRDGRRIIQPALGSSAAGQLGI